MAKQQNHREGRTYLTGAEAAHLMRCNPRTIYRRIERGELAASHDRKNRLRIAADEVYAYLEKYPVQEQEEENSLAALVQEVADLKAQVQDLRSLKEQLRRVQEHVEHLTTLIAALAMEQQQSETTSFSSSMSPLPLARPEALHLLSLLRPQYALPHLSRLEKRHLPSGSTTLADFASQHSMNLYQLKKLRLAGALQFALIDREGAIRNKQEWWITPQQQDATLLYAQQHALASTLCPHCPHQTASSEADAGEAPMLYLSEEYG